ncbi:monocarboxylate transporter 4-like [Asterias amurensis]|uniref:monocarboxylate transporter 4-like n=1 Tax=Asterias amurensis TaxID=7602 RepID=UPI003AB175E0
MITASFLSSLYVITFILTVITGSAIGISYVITKHLIGSYFNKSITTAYAVSSIGNSFVFVAFVPLIQLFLDIYGWRGTMLLIGGLSLHIALCGALMKPHEASGSQDGYEAALTDEEQETRDDDVVPSNRCGWLLLFCQSLLTEIHSSWDCLIHIILACLVCVHCDGNIT